MWKSPDRREKSVACTIATGWFGAPEPALWFFPVSKNALERMVAQQIILWLPFVKAVYQFDFLWESNIEDWDNMIHLLVLVPQIMTPLNGLGAMLDNEILQQLKSLNWIRFAHSKSIVEIRQVTLYEIHHGICSGAMFYSAYAVPSQVCPSAWPANSPFPRNNRTLKQNRPR